LVLPPLLLLPLLPLLLLLLLHLPPHMCLPSLTHSLAPLFDHQGWRWCSSCCRSCCRMSALACPLANPHSTTVAAAAPAPHACPRSLAPLIQSLMLLLLVCVHPPYAHPLFCLW
jgi:hypothetical protein